MPVEARAVRRRSNAYQIFILVLTVFSLLLMVALLLPLNQATTKLLTVYDNLICVVFLIESPRAGGREGSPRPADEGGEAAAPSHSATVAPSLLRGIRTSQATSGL